VNRIGRYLATCLVVLAILMTGCAALVLRLSLEGERALAESDTYFDQGQLRESLASARQSASLYAPGLPHIRAADARIDAIAMGAESARMQKTATIAWQAVRSTELLRPRGLGRNRERLQLANRRLTGLLAINGTDNSLADEERTLASTLGSLDEKARTLDWFGYGQLVSVGGVLLGLWSTAIAVGRRGFRSRACLSGGLVMALGTIGWTICLLFA
jgi:hypothetical protein